MDGGVQEKKEVDKLRRALREGLKRKKTLGALTSAVSSQTAHGSIQPNSPSRSSTDALDGVKIGYYSSEMAAAVTTSPFSLSPYPDSIGEASSLPEGYDTLVSSEDLKGFEATMLMNYLDHVFPLQFNCYAPPVIELGRGWLLALLTRTKPLYHAALALSCLYMHSQLLKTRRSRCIKGHWEKMNKHHALAFQELQQQISAPSYGKKEGCLKVNVEILACIVQLIYFEVGIAIVKVFCTLG